MRKLFVSTTHWLADATDASVPSAAKASRRRALLQPSILGDRPAQRPALSNSVPGCKLGCTSTASKLATEAASPRAPLSASAAQHIVNQTFSAAKAGLSHLTNH